MSNTTTTQTADATAETNAEVSVSAVLEYVHPDTLVIGDNARTDTDRALTKEFRRSVRDFGILAPLDVERRGEELVIIDGQIRCLAARLEGLDRVPVIITDPDSDDDDKARTIARIRRQWAHNERRTGFTQTERMNAIEQLHLAGVSATKIAREHLHMPKPQVDAALAATGSTAARDALATHADLTLDQAAVLATYDDDPQAVAALLAAADAGRFEHVAAEYAARAAERALIREVAEPLAAQGFTVHTDAVPEFDTAEWTNLRWLYTADGSDADDPAVFDPTTLPTDAVTAHVDVDEIEVYLDPSGQEVDEDRIDWRLSRSDDPDEVPADGCVDPRTLTESTRTVTTVDWWVHQPADHGLYSLAELRRRESESDSSPVDGPDASDAADSEVGAAERAVQRVQAAAEAEAKKKEEARRVRVLNKLALAAQEVRREELRKVLSRKTLPKGKAAEVAGFLTSMLWQYHSMLSQNSIDADAKGITRDLLGADPIDAADGASAERRQIINLAIAFGAHEANLPKDAWRGGHEYYRYVADARTAYLRFLTEVFGYTLADIEQVITGDTDATEIPLS
ncbi:ParB N-terminal domain-containing protein [Gordonia sp. N1V]|uniref:ParB N-terminal domain-containing protein n=1 Tax=Gordonia sp. N1V TaxID=3034163 RepID=UPI0023E214E1|nr:ParB N-terminal domain-containing protein [Gordonia sp. N1V]MDF3284993.1 ParB N-terminal domain-containing protein [Gordonia sp. N1V]